MARPGKWDQASLKVIVVLSPTRVSDFLLVVSNNFFSYLTQFTRYRAESIYDQEGQHPLTEQRAANFRLLANHWAERRLVTQWRHGCRAIYLSIYLSIYYEAKCVQQRCFQLGSVPLRSDIKGTKLPPANILIPLERQLIALQLCRWQFLYNETLQQTFHPLLPKLSKCRCTI